MKKILIGLLCIIFLPIALIVGVLGEAIKETQRQKRRNEYYRRTRGW